MAFTQYSSNLGRFDVDNIKGCNPLTVNITSNISCPCDIRFGDGTSGQDVFTHTYAQPGTYTIEIDYQSLNPRTDALQITVTEDLPPSFLTESCSGNEISITITDTRYDEYVVDYNNDGTPEYTVPQGTPVPSYQYPFPGNHTISVKGRNFNALDNCSPASTTVAAIPLIIASQIQSLTVQDLQSMEIMYQPVPNTWINLEYAVNGSSSFQTYNKLDNSGSLLISDPSFDTQNNYYCFRISSYDPCNNNYTYSETVCSVKAVLTLEDQVNQLSWNPGSGIIDYSICKDGACGSITTTTNNYSDTNIVCETNYCYQIIANYSNGATSSSQEVCGVAFSLAIPPPVPNLITQAGETQINVSWDSAPGFQPSQYFLQRKDKNGISQLTLTGENYTDQTSDYSCYSINYNDICGNSSETGSFVCSVDLTGYALADNNISLSWTPYTGYEQGISGYRIEKYDENGNLITDFFTTTTNYLDNTDPLTDQVAYYRIYVEPSDVSMPESHSKLIKVVKKSILSRPQAFTPNGDGLNDTFSFSGSFIRSFHLKVYNRWGELIFVTDNMESGWDGTYKGKTLPSGSYAWNASIEDMAGQSWDLTGIVALIRK